MDERTAFDTPPTTPPPAPPQGRARSNWLLAALIGAIVGALVGGLVAKLLDDDAGTPSAAGSGAYVTSVSPGTPAEAAGMRPGDVITNVGGQRVASSDELGSAVRRNKPGDSVEVRWQRAGAERSAAVTLAQTPTR